MKPPYAIGSVPSLSGRAIAYRWRLLPRVRRHRASKPQGSSERVLPWQVTMDQLIYASLSHTHYWYDVGMLKVPATDKMCCKHTTGMPESTAMFGVETAGQVYNQTSIPREKRQPQCRPVHLGRPAHTQCMVQLPEVHPKTVRSTERFPRIQHPDAQSRGTVDRVMRLRQRAPLRHAKPSSLHLSG